MNPCAYGCRITGQHLTSCEGECRGCVPRDAMTGLTLCPWCVNNLERDVAAIPYLVAHLRDAALPNAGSKPYGGDVSRSDPAERPILSGAVDAADELHAMLSAWGRVVLEEHPNGEQMAGPDPVGSWRSEDGEVVGIRAMVATVSLGVWIAPLLRWCEAQEWAAEMRRELGEAVRTTMARWPVPDSVEPAKRVDIPCPRCDMLTLTYYPPRVERQAFRVECENPDCARVFSEDEFERLKVLALNEKRRTA